MQRLWIDVINPSDAHFFGSIYPQLSPYLINVTIRDRAETAELVRTYGIRGSVIGKDDINPIKKSFNMGFRTFELAIKVKNFDYALSFENGTSVMVSKMRGRKSILFCDNDLKFLISKSYFQDAETKIKCSANYIIVPKACSSLFGKYVENEKVIAYDGYKEDVYIANYVPDPTFYDKVPYTDFVVLRPEALGSFYVERTKSIVPDILKLFAKENINVIYLPREKEEIKYADGFDIFMPKKSLNGLDLCYHANAILTGSGTLAREAACMCKTSVSFFPSERLLSVDQQLVNDGKILHSRDPFEIVEFVLSHRSSIKPMNLEPSKRVKDDVVKIINRIVNTISL